MDEQKERLYPVACMAGSMKYFDRMIDYASSLSEGGMIVLTPFRDRRDPEVVKTYKDRMIKMQQERIEIADILIVVNPDGYIGEDTRDEIDYAKSLNKEIRYLESPRGPKIITLIGSGKFKTEFQSVETYYTLKGALVFTPAIFTVSDVQKLSENDHKILDTVHRQKMRMSDEVIVVNPGGYIGDDTKEEIEWALMHGIKVTYYDQYIREAGGKSNAEN